MLQRSGGNQRVRGSIKVNKIYLQGHPTCDVSMGVEDDEFTLRYGSVVIFRVGPEFEDYGECGEMCCDDNHVATDADGCALYIAKNVVFSGSSRFEGLARFDELMANRIQASAAAVDALSVGAIHAAHSLRIGDLVVEDGVWTSDSPISINAELSIGGTLAVSAVRGLASPAHPDSAVPRSYVDTVAEGLRQYADERSLSIGATLTLVNGADRFSLTAESQGLSFRYGNVLLMRLAPSDSAIFERSIEDLVQVAKDALFEKDVLVRGDVSVGGVLTASEVVVRNMATAVSLEGLSQVHVDQEGRLFRA